jgi:integrase/recombinase XerC
MDSHSETTDGDRPDELGEFRAYLRNERRYSQYTVRNYIAAVDDYLIWLSQQPTTINWMSASNRTLRSYLISLQKGLARRTIHNRFSAIKSFYKYAKTRGWVSDNPAHDISLPKLDKKLPLYLTSDQMKALLVAPMKLSEAGRLQPLAAWRDRAIMELLYGGGSVSQRYLVCCGLMLIWLLQW